VPQTSRYAARAEAADDRNLACSANSGSDDDRPHPLQTCRLYRDVRYDPGKGSVLPARVRNSILQRRPCPSSARVQPSKLLWRKRS